MDRGSKRRSLVVSISMALVVGLIAGGVVMAAQNATTKVEVQARPFTLGINPAAVDFGVAARGDVKDGNDITVTVQSDLSFNVSICGTDIGDIDKSNLKYKLDADTDWKNLDAEAANLVTGTGSPSSQDYTVNFRLNVPASAPLGTQQGTLTFDATTF